MHHSDRDIARTGFTTGGAPKAWPKRRRRILLPAWMRNLLLGDLLAITVVVLACAGVIGALLWLLAWRPPSL